MDLQELYENNDDFKGYVDRYSAGKFSVEESLQHALVREYAMWLMRGRRWRSVMTEDTDDQ